MQNKTKTLKLENESDKNEQRINKLKGFRASHKNRWSLIHQKTLSAQAFLLYEYYLDICGYDPRNKYYGLFEYFKDEISHVFNKSEFTVDNWHKELLKKKFIILHDKKRHLYKIKYPARYEVNNLFNGQAYNAVKIEQIMNYEEILQEVYIFSQGNKVKMPKYFGNSGSKDVGITVRTYKEKSNDLSNDSLDKDKDVHIDELDFEDIEKLFEK